MENSTSPRPEKMALKLGYLVPTKANLECVSAGHERTGAGEFGISTHRATGQPVITSFQTGQVWTISWSQLIALAITAGVDIQKVKNDPEHTNEIHGDAGNPVGLRVSPVTLPNPHRAPDIDPGSTPVGAANGKRLPSPGTG